MVSGLEFSSRRSGGETTVHHTSSGDTVQPKTAGHATERVNNTQNDVGHDLICAQEKTAQLRPESRRAASPDAAAPNLISTSTATQTDTDVMKSEDIEPAVSSRAHAIAAPIRPFVTGGDETMEHEGKNKRQRTVANFLVCSSELRCHTRYRRQTSE